MPPACAWPATWPTTVPTSRTSSPACRPTVLGPISGVPAPAIDVYRMKIASTAATDSAITRRAGLRFTPGIVATAKYRSRGVRWNLYAGEVDARRCDICHDHRGHVGRPVRGRQVGARPRQRLPALDHPVRGRGRPLADRPRGRGRPGSAPPRCPRPAAVLARIARVPRLQPPLVHRTPPLPAPERVA